MLALSTFGWSVQFAAVRNLVLNSDVVFQLEGENPGFGGGRRRGLDEDPGAINDLSHQCH